MIIHILLPPTTPPLPLHPLTPPTPSGTTFSQALPPLPPHTFIPLTYSATTFTQALPPLPPHTFIPLTYSATTITQALLPLPLHPLIHITHSTTTFRQALLPLPLHPLTPPTHSATTFTQTLPPLPLHPLTPLTYSATTITQALPILLTPSQNYDDFLEENISPFESSDIQRNQIGYAEDERVPRRGGDPERNRVREGSRATGLDQELNREQVQDRSYPGPVASDRIRTRREFQLNLEYENPEVDLLMDKLDIWYKRLGDV